jgi:hypothetical protein
LLMPIHWGLFDLAFHHWKQPIETCSQRKTSSCGPRNSALRLRLGKVTQQTPAQEAPVILEMMSE